MTATADTRWHPNLLPHIWVQPSGFGPDVFAGQIIDADDGRPALEPNAWSHQPAHVPVRLAPHTQDGLDLLSQLLLEDFLRAGGKL